MAVNAQTQTQSSTKLLQNRVALVTGASRGIGAATAKLLATHGAAVGVNYYNSESIWSGRVYFLREQQFRA